MNKYNIKDIKEMSIEEKIGELIMCGISSTELTEKEYEFIRKYKVGNFILFSRNYQDTKQMKKLNSSLYELAYEVNGSIPLISIDQEGGMVTRLFRNVTFPASPMTTSSTAVVDASYKTGKIIGRDMISLGINLNLAPCLEINDDLANPLVSVRSYGGTKEIVLEETSKFINGLHDGGVLACMKHFPGAGDSKKDSHLDLPVIDKSIDELVSNEMYPFLNNKDADALMSSHCMFSSFDNYPTTLSHKLLTDFLRIEKGFKGLVISDGMEMKAISDYYGIRKGTVLALLAGCDILLLCHKMEEQLEAFEAVYEALKNNIITIELINEKVERIHEAKRKLLASLNKYTDFLSDYQVNIDDHLLMEQIVNQSYTKVLGNKPTLDKDTLILSPKAKVATIVEDEFDSRDLTSALRSNFKDNLVLEFSLDFGFDDFVLNKVKELNKVIIFSYDAYKDDRQLELINKILLLHKETYVVSLKGPMDMKLFNNLTNYSCLYEYTPNSIKTVISELKGEIDLAGKLPK